MVRFTRALAIATLVIAGTPVALSQAQKSAPIPFAFESADLKLLDQAEGLDRQFERRALVYHDAALEQQLGGILTPLLPKNPLEHVEWRLRILRDPMVNA